MKNSDVTAHIAALLEKSGMPKDAAEASAQRAVRDLASVAPGIGWGHLIRIPSVSLTNWENASLPTPRPEPVLLILAPLGCSSFLQTIQSESV